MFQLLHFICMFSRQTTQLQCLQLCKGSNKPLVVGKVIRLQDSTGDFNLTTEAVQMNARAALMHPQCQKTAKVSSYYPALHFLTRTKFT